MATPRRIRCSTCSSGNLGQSIKPYIVDASPGAISVGARCVKHDFSFVWPRVKTPYCILPNGE
eukprot:11662867-Alexandrium_andersonii.AAC.1